MFRCELCDSFLSLFQTGRLCNNCYKIRTITKCYSSETILKSLERNFLVPIDESDNDEEKVEVEEEEKETKMDTTEDNTYIEPPKKNDNYKAINASVIVELKKKQRKKSK